MLVLALIVLGAVIVVWGAMMVRKLLIIVTAVFAPLAFAGATADISTAWVRRWIETMVALIVSKLILVIIFVIGLGVLTDGLGESNGTGGASASQSITQAIIGTLILLMGGFAPWLAIKLVHFGGDHFHQVHGQARSPLAGAQSVAAAPQKAQAMAGHVGGGGLGAAGAAGSSPGVLNPVGSNHAGSSGVGEGLTSSSGSLGRQGAGSLAAGASGAAAGGGLAAVAGPVAAAAAAASAAKGAACKLAAHTSDASSSTAPAIDNCLERTRSETQPAAATLAAIIWTPEERLIDQSVTTKGANPCHLTSRQSVVPYLCASVVGPPGDFYSASPPRAASRPVLPSSRW